MVQKWRFRVFGKKLTENGRKWDAMWEHRSFEVIFAQKTVDFGRHVFDSENMGGVRVDDDPSKNDQHPINNPSNTDHNPMKNRSKPYQKTIKPLSITYQKTFKNRSTADQRLIKTLSRTFQNLSTTCQAHIKGL